MCWTETLGTLGWAVSCGSRLPQLWHMAVSTSLATAPEGFDSFRRGFRLCVREDLSAALLVAQVGRRGRAAMRTVSEHVVRMLVAVRRAWRGCAMGRARGAWLGLELGLELGLGIGLGMGLGVGLGLGLGFGLGSGLGIGLG